MLLMHFLAKIWYSRNFEFYQYLIFFNSNSFMSKVAHLTEIDSMSLVLHPNKIS